MSRRLDYRVASLNVDNLFAYRPRRSGKRRHSGQSRRPRSLAGYRDKLAKLAATIAVDLGCPELVALQEVEAGTVDVLAALTAQISSTAQAGAGSSMGAACELAPRDYGHVAGEPDPQSGVGQALLYRRDRVALLEVQNRDVAASAAIAADGEGETLMRRPLLVGRFIVYRDGLDDALRETITVATAHLKSIPRDFILRREAQARFVAGVAEELLAAEQDARLIVAGDVNADYNQPEQRAQLQDLEALAERGDLHNLTARVPDDERFSFRFAQQRVLLDWMYASSALERQLQQVQIPHLNTRTTPGRRSSDHDPIVARFAGAYGA